MKAAIALAALAATTHACESANSTFVVTSAGQRGYTANAQHLSWTGRGAAGWNATATSGELGPTAVQNILSKGTGTTGNATSNGNSTEVKGSTGKPRVEVELCAKDNSEYCDKVSLLAGRCYDLPVIAGGVMMRNLRSVSIYGGRCMIWAQFDCQKGGHTSRLFGESVVLDEACKGTRWQQWSGRALSIRCCTGGPGKEFCDVKDDKDAGCKWR